MNITRLAEQLKITPKELLEVLPTLGFSIGARAQKIDNFQVDKIVVAFKQFKKLEALKKQEENVQEIRGKTAVAVKEKTIALGDTIIVKDLAELLNMPIAKVMGEMMRNGIMASLNERLDFDTASIISEDLGFKVTRQTATTNETDDTSTHEKMKSMLADRGGLQLRPPVVVVMGHVDHGKTKLLDAIRKTNVMGGESGGITQHIGAYQTEITHKGDTRTITFLDTPGHEAFKAMRSRGGQIADIAILVVAADDGLKPQTLESIAIIQKENLPFIVAINKIDKEAADIERVKKELAEINLQPEEWGGKTICAPISATTGKGVPELLELIALIADLEDLKADPEGSAIGTIIESHVDKGEGPVATVLIQAGTLQLNDLLIVGSVSGKIKALKNWKGADVPSATPGMPVKVLGLKGLPAVGELMIVETDRKLFNQHSKDTGKISIRPSVAATSGNSSETADQAIPQLNLILKADVMGSLEAIEESLYKLNSPDAVVRIIKKSLGFPTEADILTAQATNAILISFHLKENRKITSLADERKVTILYYDVIYHVLEKIKLELEKIKRVTKVREFMGKLTILAVFKTAGRVVICGGKIIEGKARKGCRAKILRKEELVGFGDLTNLQSGKQDVSEAVSPSEVGMAITGDPVIQEGDTLEFFVEK